MSRGRSSISALVGLGDGEVVELELAGTQSQQAGITAQVGRGRERAEQPVVDEQVERVAASDDGECDRGGSVES
jgi:hypothetical protein